MCEWVGVMPDGMLNGLLVVCLFLLVSVGLNSGSFSLSASLVVSDGYRMASRNSEWNANGFSVGFKVSVGF